METLGSIIDKLATVNNKLFDAQGVLYLIRKMDFDEFKENFYSEEGMKILWEQFQKAMNLNLQRNQLILEIDLKVVEMLKEPPESLDVYIQNQHKTY
jgi:hypothetical protein